MVPFWLSIAPLLATLHSSAPTTCADGEERISHVVRSDDSLHRIAARYKSSVLNIVLEEPALERRDIEVGETLEFCGTPPKKRRRSSTKQRRRKARGPCAAGQAPGSYEVQSGDTSTQIAEKHDMSMELLLELNPKIAENPDALRAGAALQVCSEGGPAPRSPKRSRARRGKSKACGYRTPLYEHEVVPGEILSQIAARYGVRTKEIIELNSSLRANSDYLRVGQKLKVCPDIAPRARLQIQHEVRSGETISSIAAKYDLSRKELIRFQQGRLKNPNYLRIGQSLTVWKDGGIAPGFGGKQSEKGTLANGVQLTAGRHYTTKHGRLSWGTARTVRLIQSSISNYARKISGGPKVHVGDISLRSGGKFPPHLSHQTGHDVDVGYVLRGPDADKTRFVSANVRNIDLARSWALVKAFLDTGEVRYIFMDYSVQKLLYDYAIKHGTSERTLDELFQYPRGRGRHYGIIRHSRGHVNHFHVRFHAQ